MTRTPCRHGRFVVAFPWLIAQRVAALGALVTSTIISEPAVAAPFVTSTDPSNQSVGVGLNRSVKIHFANRLDPTTISSSSVYATGHIRGPVPATVTWDPGQRVITLTPDENFISGERIVVTVTKDVTDLLGDPLSNGFNLEFTTWSAPMPGASFVPAEESWSIGSVALNVTVVDLQGDRLPELVFSNVVPDSLTMLTPDGLGGFTSWAQLPSPILPRHVVAADVDNDGAVDLVCCASGPDEIAIYRNEGGGNLAPYLTYPTGQTPYGAFAGDLDADGDLDVVTANFNGHSLSVLENSGDGSFAAPVDYTAGPGADSPRWVDGTDLDGDGDIDLVCCNGYSSNVSVFHNDGEGNLSVQTPLIGVQESPNFLEVRDFNGDGHADVVTVNAGPGSISFLEGRGDGTFETPTHFPVGGTLPYGIQVADIDGDFDLDVAIPIRGVTPNAWRIMWNDGSGAFSQGELQAGGTHCHTIGVADWDLDGDLDVAAGYAISRDTYYYEQAPVPEVVLTEPAANATGAPLAGAMQLWFDTELDPQSLIPTAFRVDGDQSGPHVVDVTWLEGLNQVTLTPMTPFLPGEIVTVTVNGNGSVRSGEGVPHDGFAFQFMAEGAVSSTTFGVTTIPLPGTDPVDLATVEIDGDGVSDVVVANYLSNDVTLLLTGGDGLPAVSASYAVGSAPIAIWTGDLDGDGYADVAVANLVGSSVSFLMNAGDGTLVPGAARATTGAPFGVHGGDFDRDGDLDLAVAELDPDGVYVYWNDGNGTFPAVDDIGAVGVALDISVSDVDRDGDLDIISVDSGNHRVEVFLWDQESGFSSGGIYGTGTTPVGIFPWDTNGDEWIDLVTADYGGGHLSILENDRAHDERPASPGLGGRSDRRWKPRARGGEQRRLGHHRVPQSRGWIVRRRHGLSRGARAVRTGGRRLEPGRPGGRGGREPSQRRSLDPGERCDDRRGRRGLHRPALDPSPGRPSESVPGRGRDPARGCPSDGDRPAGL
jgi:hypothetical protein